MPWEFLPTPAVAWRYSRVRKGYGRGQVWWNYQTQSKAVPWHGMGVTLGLGWREHTKVIQVCPLALAEGKGWEWGIARVDDGGSIEGNLGLSLSAPS